MPRKAGARANSPVAKVYLGRATDLPPDTRVAWRYVHCAGSDLFCDKCGTVSRYRKRTPTGAKCLKCGNPDAVRKSHHFDNIACDCPPGPQSLAITHGAREVALGGGRGSAKTEVGFAFSAKGNWGPGWDLKDPRNVSYLNHPAYRFLVLRKNVKDLDDWKRRAIQFYSAYGGQLVESPVLKFRFPSGAEGVLDHMDDDSAYEKYQGAEFTRIIFEEVTQIPSELLYAKILLSCRSPLPELVEQTLATTNPGGNGNGWFVRRFIDSAQDVRDGIYTQKDENGRERVFIHSTVDDNPYYSHLKPEYIRELDALKEVDEFQWRMWRLGDFKCAPGSYFPMFRPKGPMGDNERKKYPWANHVIPAGSVPLMPWYHRWMAMDWGVAHECATYWACQHPSGQVHIYREMVRKDTLIAHVGAEVALASLDDLRGLESHSMTLWLSHELFSKTGEEKSRAEQLGEAISRVLGPNSVAVLSVEEEHSLDDTPDRFWSDRRFQKGAGIIIRRARTERIAGWQYIRELMRFVPAVKPAEAGFDYNYWLWLSQNESAEKAEEYRLAFAKAAPELLPKLQIWDSCPLLIEAIPRAMRDEKNPEDVTRAHWDGADRADACLVAGTLVETADGPVAIEDVQAGQLVHTRAGLKPVVASGMTNPDAEVFRVLLSSGESLLGTANHPVFVEPKGFVPLSELRPGDRVLSWKSHQQSLSSTESSSDEHPIHRDGNCECTTGRPTNAARKASRRCTGKSGSLTTGLSQREWSSTTATATRSTTTSATWSASPQSNTPSSTSLQRVPNDADAGLNISARSLPLGIPLTPAASGIRNTGRTYSEIAHSLMQYAITAAQLIKRILRGALASAQTTASRIGEGSRASTTSQEFASSAGRFSTATSTPRNGFAPVIVLSVRAEGRSPVYNLSVAEQPEYFANGVLVHNCRYVAMAYKHQSERLPKQEYVNRKLAANERDGLTWNQRVQIAEKATTEWEGEQIKGGFFIPRASSRRNLWNGAHSVN